MRLMNRPRAQGRGSRAQYQNASEPLTFGLGARVFHDDLRSGSVELLRTCQFLSSNLF